MNTVTIKAGADTKIAFTEDRIATLEKSFYAKAARASDRAAIELRTIAGLYGSALYDLQLGQLSAAKVALIEASRRHKEL